MIFNLLTIKWEGWARWVEVGGVDLGCYFGALFYLGKVQGGWEWDFLFIKLIVRWTMERGDWGP